MKTDNAVITYKEIELNVFYSIDDNENITGIDDIFLFDNSISIITLFDDKMKHEVIDEIKHYYY